MLLVVVIVGVLGWWHGRQMYELGRQHEAGVQRLQAHARAGRLIAIDGGQARRRSPR